MLKTWRNKEGSDVVKQIIDNNFKILGRYLSKQILCLSRQERLSLTGDHLSSALIVYDTTDKKWYQYQNEGWIEYKITYTSELEKNDWVDGKITIPYSVHLINNPTVELFILSSEGTYEKVIGGVNTDTSNNVILSSDINFEGKVVIK